MRNWFERITRSLMRRGVREGLLGGSGVWLAVGAVSWLLRFLARSPERRVVVEEIRLGETIVVTSVPPPPSGRRRRKQEADARRTARAAAKQIRHERRHAAAVPAGEQDADERHDTDGKRARRAGR
jgi:hypothetical protein